MQSHSEDADPEVREESPRSQDDINNNSRCKKSLGSASDVEDDETQPAKSPSNQIVLYKSGTSTGDTGLGIEQTPDSIGDRRLSLPNSSAQNASRSFQSIGAFTVQCARCFQWRLIPTKEKYEAIRENILEDLFFCEKAQEWRPNVSCSDPPDICQDGTRVWAIDKPSIAQPPPGWERLLRIRGEGSTKFADVYYVAPSGKRMRSMVEVQKYLFEHPEYLDQGLSLSQFSFQTPKPLQANYLRKRPRPAAPSNDMDTPPIPKHSEPEEVKPLSWEEPAACTDLQLGRPEQSTSDFQMPKSHFARPPSKKKTSRPSKKQMYSSAMFNETDIKVEEPPPYDL